MDWEKVKLWAVAALVRALKTGAQTIAALIGTELASITSFDWLQILAVAATAMVASLLTSVVGVPEVAEGSSPLSRS